jgi:hypothetical protein
MDEICRVVRVLPDSMRSRNALRRANTTARSKTPYSDSSLRCFLSYVLRLGQGSERGCPAAAVCLAGTSQLAMEDTIRSPGRSCRHRHGLHTPDKLTSEHFPISTAATPIPIMTSDYPGKTTAIAVPMPQGNQTVGSPSMRAFHSVRCWVKLRSGQREAKKQFELCWSTSFSGKHLGEV